MTIKSASTAAILALGLVVAAVPGEAGQPQMGAHQGMGPGPMMGPGMMGHGTGPGMMGQGMGPGMMGHGMMGPGMMGQGMSPGMTGPGTMGQGMGPGMMGQGMGPGIMGPGMMSPGMGQSYSPGPMGQGMMGQGMQRFRVVPMMHLSTDDVRQFLQRHISAHGLMHLQVGDVTETDDETITAEIVTREGSLALRLEIDPYTGFVKSVS
jgi:hypothetical protein